MASAAPTTRIARRLMGRDTPCRGRRASGTERRAPGEGGGRRAQQVLGIHGLADVVHRAAAQRRARELGVGLAAHEDRKSTRLNSSHLVISYAVFCLKKKKKKK